jgi:exodeoxyribonuclease VII small subunit
MNENELNFDSPKSCGEQSQPAPSFEHSLAELEAIVHDLEDGQLGLGDALARYEQGVKHLKHCYALLTQAEQKIELLTGVAEDGTPIAQPYAVDDESPAKPAARRRAKAKPPMPSDDELAGFGRDIDG